MERHRHQLADAAIEEQLEVQTAFREHGARLQGIYDKRQRTEYENAKRWVARAGHRLGWAGLGWAGLGWSCCLGQQRLVRLLELYCRCFLSTQRH
jgi:hypothetical protein